MGSWPCVHASRPGRHRPSKKPNWQTSSFDIDIDDDDDDDSHSTPPTHPTASPPTDPS